SSGLVVDHAWILKAEGPHLELPLWMPWQDPEDGHWVPPPPKPPPAPRDTIRTPILLFPKPDQFQVGHHYWIAPVGYSRSSIVFWPADSDSVSHILEKGVEQNAYAWRPQMWKTSYTTGVFDETNPAGSRIRLWRFGHLRWERHFAGALTYWYLQEGQLELD